MSIQISHDGFPVDENGIRIRSGLDPLMRMDGSGDGGGGDGGGDGGGTGTGTGDDQNTNDDQLGEGGKKALDAERSARSKAEKQARDAAARAEELERKLQEIANQNKSDAEKEREKAVKDAEERVRKEVQTTSNMRLVRSEVRVAAAGKLHDPEDAVRYLDLTEFKVDDDGEVNTAEISKAIDALLKTKPYLAAKANKPSGDVDQGGRGDGGGGGNNVKPGVDRMRDAYANSGKSK